MTGCACCGLPQGEAARNETAFRHALKTGHRLRQQGKRLTDSAIIDAYEHAYNVAQAHGGAGRSSEMPPMRDRQTMARRVRGYVLSPRVRPTPALVLQVKLPAANANHSPPWVASVGRKPYNAGKPTLMAITHKAD